MPTNKANKCKCCGRGIIKEPGTMEECSVCGWMEDPYQEDFPDNPGGANIMSLNEARAAYKTGKKVR